MKQCPGNILQRPVVQNHPREMRHRHTLSHPPLVELGSVGGWLLVDPTRGLSRQQLRQGAPLMDLPKRTYSHGWLLGICSQDRVVH